VSGIFSDTDLAELRDLVRPTMPWTCDVQTGGNGQPFVNVTGLTGLPCGFSPAGVPREAVTADAIRAATRFDVRFPVESFTPGGPAILSSHTLRVTHGVPGMPSPIRFRVLGDQPKASDEVRRIVAAERVAGGG